MACHAKDSSFTYIVRLADVFADATICGPVVAKYFLSYLHLRVLTGRCSDIHL